MQLAICYSFSTCICQEVARIYRGNRKWSLFEIHSLFAKRLHESAGKTARPTDPPSVIFQMRLPACTQWCVILSKDSIFARESGIDREGHGSATKVQRFSRTSWLRNLHHWVFTRIHSPFCATSRIQNRPPSHSQCSIYVCPSGSGRVGRHRSLLPFYSASFQIWPTPHVKTLRKQQLCNRCPFNSTRLNFIKKTTASIVKYKWPSWCKAMCKAVQ